MSEESCTLTSMAISGLKVGDNVRLDGRTYKVARIYCETAITVRRLKWYEKVAAWVVVRVALFRFWLYRKLTDSKD